MENKMAYKIEHFPGQSNIKHYYYTIIMKDSDNALIGFEKCMTHTAADKLFNSLLPACVDCGYKIEYCVTVEYIQKQYISQSYKDKQERKQQKSKLKNWS